MGLFSFLSGKQSTLEHEPGSSGGTPVPSSDGDASAAVPLNPGSAAVPLSPGSAAAPLNPGSAAAPLNPESAAVPLNPEPRTAPLDPEPSAADSPFVPPDAWASHGLDVGALTAPPAGPTGTQPQVGEPDPALTAQYQGPIIEVIKTVFDPEIPVDVYELGLIYDIGVDAKHQALIKMTLTSPACPSAQQLPSEVRYKVKAVPGIHDAAVEIVWEPPWEKDRMSEAAKLQLGFF